MPNQLVVVTAIAILQWLCITASVGIAQWLDQSVPVPLWFEPNAFFAGNLQIIIVLWVYQTITKYIKF
jgi:hypothetical protein